MPFIFRFFKVIARHIEQPISLKLDRQLKLSKKINILFNHTMAIFNVVYFTMGG